MMKSRLLMMLMMPQMIDIAASDDAASPPPMLYEMRLKRICRPHALSLLIATR